VDPAPDTTLLKDRQKGPDGRGRNQEEDTMSHETKTKTFNVDYFIYHFEDRKHKKAVCSRIGIASLAKDGVSINFKLNAFPVDGRGTLIVPKQDEAVDSSYRDA
jgi:hypothetical protein